MPEEFEDQDLSGAVFWGVNLQRARFRDADFGGARFFHTFWSDVTVDGVIDRLVINGVDVTEYVNENDRWYPLRTELSPDTVEGVHTSWAALQNEWTTVVERVSSLDPSVVVQSVDGEWSLRDTMRHLIFAMDKWFTWPLLGERTFAAIGLPNTGSQSFDWPGIDLSLDPSFDEVLAECVRQEERFRGFLVSADPSEMPAEVEVLENGMVPPLMCLHVVLEEEFEHLRYVLRDLAVIAP
jgi:hypothetical protein